MSDQINEGGTPPTAEEAARIAAVEARRLADRDRKREQRAREKRERESSPRYRESQIEESREKAAARRSQEQRNRAALIVSELTPPILPDEELEGSPGKSYWADFFIKELEPFIDEHQRAFVGDWERLYRELSLKEAGRRTLEFFGVEPFPLPAGSKLSGGYIVTPTTILNDFPKSDADSERIAVLKQLWDANRLAKKDWKP